MVIKVLKPGVEDVLATDLNFLYVTSRVLELINPELARTSLTGIISDIRCGNMAEQVSCSFSEGLLRRGTRLRKGAAIACLLG